MHAILQWHSQLNISVSRSCSKSAKRTQWFVLMFQLDCICLHQGNVWLRNLQFYIPPKTCLVLMGLNTLKNASFEHHYQKAFEEVWISTQKDSLLCHQRATCNIPVVHEELYNWLRLSGCQHQGSMGSQRSIRKEHHSGPLFLIINSPSYRLSKHIVQLTSPWQVLQTRLWGTPGILWRSWQEWNWIQVNRWWVLMYPSFHKCAHPIGSGCNTQATPGW